MKNKFGIEIEKFAELGSSGDSEESLKSRRESPAPRIVVCPPMEERLSPEAVGERGARLLRAFGRRISRRRRDDDASSSSSSGSELAWSERAPGARDSFSASEGSSEAGSERRRHRSTVSLRRLFQSLSISPRAHSCASDRSRPSKKNPQPKRILRAPVTYTYVRGLSGLPTQRVPRSRVPGLNR